MSNMMNGRRDLISVRDVLRIKQNNLLAAKNDLLAVLNTVEVNGCFFWFILG